VGKPWDAWGIISESDNELIEEELALLDLLALLQRGDERDAESLVHRAFLYLHSFTGTSREPVKRKGLDQGANCANCKDDTDNPHARTSHDFHRFKLHVKNTSLSK